MKLRAVMATVALLAILLGIGLGLRRRSERLATMAQAYGRAANRFEERLEGLGSGEAQAVLDRVHWNDAVADAYRQAASRPWIPGDPKSGRITCQCSYHAKLASTRQAP